MSPSRKLLVRLSLLILFMLLLSACGDGDGDGGGSNTYSVGGSVSGLVGTLVLQNNAGDDLTITADGNFTFPTRLASGSAFQVSVSSQPSNQTCNVSNGSGTVSGNITSVDVACTSLYSTIGRIERHTRVAEQRQRRSHADVRWKLYLHHPSWSWRHLQCHRQQPARQSDLQR